MLARRTQGRDEAQISFYFSAFSFFFGSFFLFTPRPTKNSSPPFSPKGADPFLLLPHDPRLSFRHPGLTSFYIHTRTLIKEPSTSKQRRKHIQLFAMYTSENIKRRNPIGSSTTRDQSLQQPQDDHHHSNAQNRASDPYGQNPLKPAFQQQQHQQAGGSGVYGHRDHYQFGYAPPRKQYSANKVFLCCFVFLFYCN